MAASEFMPSIVKIVERAVVAAQRQGIVTETHVGAGAVAGAAHAALEQLVAKAAGWTVLCLALAWRFCCKVYDSMYLLGAEEKQALLEDGADVVLFGFLAFLFGLSAVAAVCSKAAFFRLLVRKPSLAKRVCADAFCFLLWCGVVFWFCIVFMIRG